VETLKKQSLFWDVDREKLSSDEDWFFIIERILEFGDIDDLFWMKRTFCVSCACIVPVSHLDFLAVKEIKRLS
jgi:hypothetical protein